MVPAEARGIGVMKSGSGQRGPGGRRGRICPRCPSRPPQFRLNSFSALSLVALMVVALMPCVLIAQPTISPQNSRPANADRNKYALIINGASGEPAYAKQF